MENGGLDDIQSSKASSVEMQAALNEVSSLADSVRGYQSEIEALRSRAQQSLADGLEVLEKLKAAGTAALAAKTKIEDEQAVIATKSSHIQGAQEHADKVRAELDRLLTAASLLVTEAEGHKSRTQSASDTAAELLASLRSGKAVADADAAATAASKDVAKSAAQTSKSLAERAEAIESKVIAYEKRLTELEEQASKQLETITGLLPGATAAGLAHAFDDRRKKFLDPSDRWQKIFVGSLIALVILALSGLWTVYRGDSVPSWDALARLWIARLPIAGALIWLALHASRESALAKRLEEDYGYKAAIATSFLGFQKQMAEIGQQVQEGAPLSKLCQDTLSTIGSPPGRIYDKHQLTVTPAGELAKAMKSEAASKN